MSWSGVVRGRPAATPDRGRISMHGEQISGLTTELATRMARALLAAPRILLADEPTQGVDVGARAEIYQIMRDVAGAGVPVVVVSSDAKELEWLCDRVVVFSRGHVVAELLGDEVTEENITGRVVGATTLRGQESIPTPEGERGSRLRHLIKGDYTPSLILALVILALGAYTFAQNARYLAPFNVISVLTLLTAPAFISMGQTVVIMTGGIDLSVGPLAGLLVVIVVAAASGLLSGCWCATAGSPR